MLQDYLLKSFVKKDLQQWVHLYQTCHSQNQTFNSNQIMTFYWLP